MRAVVLDLETNIRNVGDTAVGNMLASPFHVDNTIVAFGELWLSKGEVMTKIEYNPSGLFEQQTLKGDLSGEMVSVALGKEDDRDDVLIIGHNIPFDLLYLMKFFPLVWEARQQHIYIWDTAQVEYLLEGQSHMYPSLDECCIKRGLPVKDDKVKAYWDQGIDTPLIPKDLLLDYLMGDLTNTYAVFKSQWEAVSQKPKLMALVKAKMDDILMTTTMTWNGMNFNLELAEEKLKVLDKELGEVYAYLKTNGQMHFKPNFDFDPESPKQISTVLFGGNYKTIEDLPVLDDEGNEVRYKGGQRAGQVKTKKTEVVHFTTGFNLPTKGIPKNARDGYSTAEEYLVKLKSEYVTKLLRFRELSKDAETYFRGYSKLVWPDGKIHPQRNHTSTITGRLSCSSPNLENVSKPDED